MEKIEMEIKFERGQMKIPLACVLSDMYRCGEKPPSLLNYLP